MGYTSAMANLAALSYSCVHWDPAIQTTPECSCPGRRIWRPLDGHGSTKSNFCEAPVLRQPVFTRFNPTACVSGRPGYGYDIESFTACRALLNWLFVVSGMLEYCWHRIATHSGCRHTSEKGVRIHCDGQRRVVEEGLLVFGVSGPGQQHNVGEVPRTPRRRVGSTSLPGQAHWITHVISLLALTWTFP